MQYLYRKVIILYVLCPRRLSTDYPHLELNDVKSIKPVVIVTVGANKCNEPSGRMKGTRATKSSLDKQSLISNNPLPPQQND